MALFSSNKRVVFQPTAYGSTRRRRRVPRWLVLILTGIVLGAGGLLFLQKSYGPPRLTAEESERLHQDLNSANIDKQRLQSQLAQQTRDLEETRSALSSHDDRLAQLQGRVSSLQEDIQMLVKDIPPDPRGTSPGIRAAELTSQAGTLNYQVLVMQDDPSAATFEGRMTFVVEGRYPNGRSNTITLDPIEFNVDHYQYVKGSVPLPDGMTARLVTIRITQGESTRLSATRTIRVR
ncbi:DUF6776 family protein [Pusillimonas noertemannii]|uniref:Uncharacterized protein n=1 Tax=Pusillimonas noertemannii TaxID=305977 RepID=A0A2U1CKP0_9BURK|nr:DUF6776 family protein [Pusillimonas noertemannii]NYT69090.1 hypothetical protein [Pusillimonas noertemannii]PVY61558.1 hypothetical protein C7440_2283 [Pusillimonas noertemannii]TFL09505.1 hypothetical protein CSC72_11500 [Pusillimonas noertemannii]